MRGNSMRTTQKAELFGIPIALDGSRRIIASTEDFEEWLLAILEERQAEMTPRGALGERRGAVLPRAELNSEITD